MKQKNQDYVLIEEFNSWVFFVEKAACCNLYCSDKPD